MPSIDVTPRNNANAGFYIGKALGIIFILVGLFILNSNFNEASWFLTILKFLFCYIFIYVGLNYLFPNIIESNKTLNFLFSKILTLPLYVVVYYQYFASPFFSLLIFISLYFLPSAIILLLKDQFSFINTYSLGLIYILNVASVLIFAYYGKTIMREILITSKTQFLKKHLEKNNRYTRMYTYIFMITIYIIYNFTYFNGIEITFIPNDYFSVLKEVFVTFVAIDSFIQIIKHKTQSN